MDTLARSAGCFMEPDPGGDREQDRLALREGLAGLRPLLRRGVQPALRDRPRLLTVFDIVRLSGYSLSASSDHVAKATSGLRLLDDRFVRKLYRGRRVRCDFSCHG